MAMLDSTGLTFGVLIQVSVHGTDNRLMLNVLKQHPNRLRGIGVAPLDLGESHYLRLKEAGVVGLRLNNLFGGGIGFERLEEYDSLAREFGWHLQFFTNLESLYEIRSRVAKLKSIVVIDHMGSPYLGTNLSNASVNTKYFQNLVGMITDGAWVKLSGGFRISRTGFPYSDTIPFARALLETSPARCLWGSDWPHVAHWGFMMSVGDLLDLFADWAPEAELQRRVLVDNPRLLYGFGQGI
jgi:predicted TIM-barrel fold metal-dependent hydrolase